MKLHIRGKGPTISPALEGRDRLHKVEVVLVIGGITARGELETKGMYGSIDGIAEKLERQVRRHKTKLDRARYPGGQRKAAAL